MENVMDSTVRTLGPQESRVVLALAEKKRREVGRPEIIKLLGASAKAADNVIESLRRERLARARELGGVPRHPARGGTRCHGRNQSSRARKPYR